MVQIAVAQVDVTLGDVAANLEHARDVIRCLAAQGPDLVVFPELTLHGYALGQVKGDPCLRADDPRLARDRFSAAWPLYFADPGAAASRHHIERLRREFTLDPAAAQAAMRFAYDQADIRLLPPIAGPVLVVAGGHDVVCGTPHADAIAAAMPTVTVRAFPDCGHIPQYEQPDAFTRAVFEWWDAADTWAE